MNLFLSQRRIITIMSMLALTVSVMSCVPDDKADVVPTPAPPTITSRSNIYVAHLVVPQAPNTNADLGYSFSVKNAFGNGFGNISYGWGIRRTLEWFGSDSAQGRVGIKLTHSGTTLDESGLYSRTNGSWIFVMGSRYAGYPQALRTVKVPYYATPADTTMRTFAYLHADPSHGQVRVLYNNTVIGTVNYGEMLPAQPAFMPQAGDRIVAVNAANINDTISKTDIAPSLTENVSIICLKAFLGRKGSRDTTIYRHQVFSQY